SSHWTQQYAPPPARPVSATQQNAPPPALPVSATQQNAPPPVGPRAQQALTPRRQPPAANRDASTARRHHPFTHPGQTASMSTPEEASTPTPDATANSGAVAVIGLDLRGETPAPRKQVYSWALWDWATQPFNTVILT